MRWPIIRNSLALLVLVSGLAIAGRNKRREPPPVEEERVQAEPQPTPPPPAPALFPDGLPITLEHTPEGLSGLSAQGCNGCHVQAHDDWAGSAHALGWRSASFQAAIARAGDATACTSCHLPLTSQHSELAVGYIENSLSRPMMEDNPSWDPTMMAEGIGCAACHIREGTILGTRVVENAPHPVVPSTELTSSAACATCHQLTWPEADQPFYDTYGEWERSAYATAGVRCQDCHMPPQAGAAVATRFAATASHAISSDIKRAVSVYLSMDAPVVQRGEPYAVDIRLLNTGSGHHFPTGSPFKTYQLRATILNAEGETLATPMAYDLSRTISEEQPWNTLSDTRLPAGESIELNHVFEVDQRTPPQMATLQISIDSGEQEQTILQELPIQIL